MELRNNEKKWNERAARYEKLFLETVPLWKKTFIIENNVVDV